MYHAQGASEDSLCWSSQDPELCIIVFPVSKEEHVWGRDWGSGQRIQKDSAVLYVLALATDLHRSSILYADMPNQFSQIVNWTTEHSLSHTHALTLFFLIPPPLNALMWTSCCLCRPSAGKRMCGSAMGNMIWAIPSWPCRGTTRLFGARLRTEEIPQVVHRDERQTGALIHWPCSGWWWDTAGKCRRRCWSSLQLPRSGTEGWARWVGG